MNSKTRTQEVQAYCAFKDDRERKQALISRDVRLVLIALIAAYGAHKLIHFII